FTTTTTTNSFGLSSESDRRPDMYVLQAFLQSHFSVCCRLPEEDHGKLATSTDAGGDSSSLDDMPGVRILGDDTEVGGRLPGEACEAEGEPAPASETDSSCATTDAVADPLRIDMA
ncbi:unnamed protein product, partial [Polarella glacialis]